jgi:DnaJ domain
MNLNSPLFDRVRIRSEGEEAQESARPCDHPGCTGLGVYRAPMGRRREGQYYFFCLAHVQEYNKNYNYFSGMRDDDIATFQKDAMTGHRPTRPMNIHGPGDARMEASAKAGLSAAEILERLRRMRSKEAQRRTVGNAAKKALDRLGLDETATPDAIKQRFKELVKRFHPDSNRGDRSMEDRMREVIEAYNYLKQAELA